jgi:hypothetical protein
MVEVELTKTRISPWIEMLANLHRGDDVQLFRTFDRMGSQISEAQAVRFLLWLSGIVRMGSFPVDNCDYTFTNDHWFSFGLAMFCQPTMSTLRS